MVKIPLTKSLSLSSLGLVSEDAKEVHDGTYHLCGVFHHHGGTVRNGHFTAYAKRKLRDVEDQWILFNDNVCKETTLDDATGIASEFNQRNCYMAFYELKCEDDVMEEDADAAASNKDVEWITLVQERDGRSVEKGEIEKAPVGSSIPCVCKREYNGLGNVLRRLEKERWWRCILHKVSENDWNVFNETMTVQIDTVVWETGDELNGECLANYWGISFVDPVQCDIESAIESARNEGGDQEEDGDGDMEE
jgi:hypothetical protein